MKGQRLRAVVLSLSSLACAWGCAGRSITIPSDPGVPLAGFQQIHERVSAACRDVRTLTAEVGLSGQAGSQPLRGTLHVGFSRPRSMRLQMLAGLRTAFILVANDTGATLLMDNRVLRDKAPDEILGALIDVTLGPPELQAVLTGCVLPDPRATAGRLHEGGWASIELEGGATVYLQRRGDAWRVRAARRGDWRVEYPDWPDGSAFPARVRLASSARADVDVRGALSQVRSR